MKLLLSLIASFAFAGFNSGESVKDFTLKNENGEIVKLSSFKGKTVVLEWLNHGCPFVKKHYGSNNMQGLQKKYTAKGVVWLSVISSAEGKQGYSTPEKAIADKKKFNSSANHILLDTDGKVGQMFGAKTTPHMYIIDKAGKLRYQGAIDSTPSTDKDDIKESKNYVNQALTELLADKKISIEKTKAYGCSVKY